jgi:hypothetical protein
MLSLVSITPEKVDNLFTVQVYSVYEQYDKYVKQVEVKQSDDMRKKRMRGMWM